MNVLFDLTFAFWPSVCLTIHLWTLGSHSLICLLDHQVLMQLVECRTMQVNSEQALWAEAKGC